MFIKFNQGDGGGGVRLAFAWGAVCFLPPWEIQTLKETTFKK